MVKMNAIVSSVQMGNLEHSVEDIYAILKSYRWRRKEDVEPLTLMCESGAIAHSTYEM